MSADVEFSADAWRKGGQAWADEASALQQAIQRHVEALDVNALGSHQGGHLFDMAVATVVPLVKEAFLEACQNLAGNIDAVGQAMQQSGHDYADFEGATAQQATSFLPPS